MFQGRPAQVTQFPVDRADRPGASSQPRRGSVRPSKGRKMLDSPDSFRYKLLCLFLNKLNLQANEGLGRR